ncbi:MAG: SH3 domain-containing protein [Anaerolineales bacterium]
MSFSPNALSQRDPQWINENLGFDTAVTIGTDGATLTCLAMLVNGYGYNETPSSLNHKLKDLGSGIGFLGSLIVWPGLTHAFPRVTFRRIIICRDQPAPMDIINACMDAGQPLLIEIDKSPSAGLQNHWVIIYSRQGEDYLMLDPWPQPPDSAPALLSNCYGFGRPPAEFITTVAWYDAVSAPPPAPAPVSDIPGTGLPVCVKGAVTAGLSLYSTPAIAGANQATEPPGTLLRCLEPDSAALAKIGVMDQWLHVSDPQGLDGYVAAWYVEKAEGYTPTPVLPLTPQPVAPPAPPPTPLPQPALGPAGLIVLVSQSIGPAGLRLRDRPDTNGNTLATLSAGAELAVLEPSSQALPKIGQMNQWLNVQDGRGYTGYAAAWYVEMKNTGPSVPPPAAATAVVTVSSQASAGLRLRDGPSTDASILKILKPGTSLTVLEEAGDIRTKIGVNNQWLNVREPGGMTGYVAAGYVTV